MPDPSQFNTDRTCPGRWTVSLSNAPINMFVRTTIVDRTLDDDDLDSCVDALVPRLASFDRETLPAAKARINRFGTPTATELHSSNNMFFLALARPVAQARRAKVRSIGYEVPSDFELNFGRYLPSLGRADDDGTDTKQALPASGA